MIRRFQTGALKMEEKMSPNDVKKNGGKIEEYMVRAGKIVDSPNAWLCLGIFAARRAPGLNQGPI
jgi:hypothetical protein